MWLCGRRMRVSIHLTGVKGSVLSLPYLGMDLVGPLLVHSTGRFLKFFVAEEEVEAGESICVLT